MPGPCGAKSWNLRFFAFAMATSSVYPFRVKSLYCMLKSPVVSRYESAVRLLAQLKRPEAPFTVPPLNTTVV